MSGALRPRVLPVPSVPLAGGLRLAQRAMMLQALDVETHDLPGDGPVVVVANHPSVIDAGVLRRVWPTPLTTSPGAIGRRSVLLFGEDGVSPDGSLGGFHAHVLEPVVRAWRRGRAVPLVAVAITGTHGLGAELPWVRSQVERPHVVVRAARPLAPRATTPEELAATARTEVARLLAEDATTWWRVQRDPQDDDVRPPSWRTAWGQGGAVRPGTRSRRRIWR